MPRFTVHKKDLQKGAKIEMRRHPWLSDPRARRFARDNLMREGPGFYRADKMDDGLIRNINRKMGARPLRRKRAPDPLAFLHRTPW